MAKSPLGGVKIFLTCLFLFFVITVGVVFYLSFKDGTKNLKANPNVEEMSMEEVRRAASRR